MCSWFSPTFNSLLRDQEAVSVPSGPFTYQNFQFSLARSDGNRRPLNRIPTEKLSILSCEIRGFSYLLQKNECVSLSILSCEISEPHLPRERCEPVVLSILSCEISQTLNENVNALINFFQFSLARSVEGIIPHTSVILTPFNSLLRDQCTCFV